MTKPAVVKPGVDGEPQGGKVSIGYEVDYGEGAKAYIEIVLPKPDQEAGDAAQVHVSRGPVFIDLLEALKAWQVKDGQIRGA
jgi:hypothetical protein